MISHTSLLFRALLSLVFASFVFFYGASSAFAVTYEVTGWGWSADDSTVLGTCTFPPCATGGLGWMSFSNKSDQSAIPYGVFIDGTTGDFSGYAWSSTFGWITFNAFEMQKCGPSGTNRVLPVPPSVTPTVDPCPPFTSSPKAHIDIDTDPVTGEITGGTGYADGWARSCSVFVSGCSGDIRPDDETGGWDGWISLAKPGGAGPFYSLLLDMSVLPTTVLKFLGPEDLDTDGPGPDIAYNPNPPTCNTCMAWGGGVSGEGFTWGINLGGLSVSLVPATLPPLLSFWADQTVLVSGQTTLLHWITSPNVTSCTTGSTPADSLWVPKPVSSGVQSQSVRLPAFIGTTQQYTLRCTDPGGILTPLRTVDISIISGQVVPVDGACGAANGVPTRSAPSLNLCGSGNPSAVTKDTSVTPNMWRWSCSGINSGQTALCSAEVKKTFRILQF